MCLDLNFIPLHLFSFALLYFQFKFVNISLNNFSVFFRAMSSAATTPPSVDKVDGFSRKSVRKAKQKRSQSSSQFRSQGKPIELTPLPLLKGDAYFYTHLNTLTK